jgi:hypothetical protein
MKHVCLSCQLIPHRFRLGIHQSAMTADPQWTKNFGKRSTWRGQQPWVGGLNKANMLGRDAPWNSSVEGVMFSCGELEESCGL